MYSFFVIYANIDGFDPGELLSGNVGELDPATLAGGKGYRPPAERRELDRWVLSELNRTAQAVVEHMDAYDNYAACGRLNAFVDELSNWYVRRSRDRFWAGEKQTPDKLDAYWTLYECLVTTTKLIAPFVPFLAEALWQNLAGVFGGRATESVHLCDYPAGDAAAVDEELSSRMSLAQEISSLGRAARMEAKLKVRQPLARVEVILAHDSDLAWLRDYGDVAKAELNVKEVEFTLSADQYITYQVQPNFKRLGPRVGKLMPQVKKALTQAEGGQLLAEMKEQGKVTLTVEGETIELDGEDIEVRLQAKEGWAAAQGKQCVVVLSTELTPELVREGLARDLVRIVNDRRKEMGCEFTDRIKLSVVTDDAEVIKAIEENLDYIKQETLATEILMEAIPSAESTTHELGEAGVKLYVQVVEG